MTTIAWDGRVLAADSRSSTPEQRPHEGQLDSNKRICFHCERPAWTGRDDAMKMVVLPKVTWKGERILAAASTGSASSCDRIRDVMRMPPEGLTDLEKIWDTYTKLAPRRIGGPAPFGSISAMFVVVTEKHLWVLDFESTSLTAYLEPRDKPFAKGSGRDAAMLAMTVMGANAAQAVWAARAIDPATGGAVRWMDTTVELPETIDRQFRIEVLQSESPMSREEAAEYVRSGFKTRPANPEPVGVTTTPAEASIPSAELSAAAAGEIAAAARASKAATKPKAPRSKEELQQHAANAVAIAPVTAKKPRRPRSTVRGALEGIAAEIAKQTTSKKTTTRKTVARKTAKK